MFDGAKNLMVSDNRITVLFEASDYNSVAFGYSTKQFLNGLSQAGWDVYYLDELDRLHGANDDNKKLGNSIYNFVTFNQSFVKKMKENGMVPGEF